jgi:hypothetical protein
LRWGLPVTCERLGRCRAAVQTALGRESALLLCVLTAMTWAAGCRGDYRFETHARYRAPVGGFDLVFHANGTVRSGADISSESSSSVRIEPLGKTGLPIELTVSLPGNPGGIVVDAIRSAGYPATGGELDEVTMVVNGVLAGSKGTRVEGQTRALTVIETSFSYH